MGKPADATSYIYRSGTSPHTRVAISQKNKIYGYMCNNGGQGFQQIGAVSEFSQDESKSVEAVRGIGYGDQVAELVPSITEPMTLSLNKSLMYAVNLFQTVGYKAGVEGLVRSLKHHRWPFDLKQELVFSELAGSAQLGDIAGTTVKNASKQANGANYLTPIRALFTYFEGCWFNSYNVSYTSDAAIVSETSSVTVSDIIDGVSQYGEFIDSGLAPVSSVGAAGRGFSLRFQSDSNQAATNL